MVAAIFRNSGQWGLERMEGVLFVESVLFSGWFDPSYRKNSTKILYVLDDDSC